jgi:DNA-binding GntR family transcriptional regulator
MAQRLARQPASGDELTSAGGRAEPVAGETMAERAARLIEDAIVRLDLAPGLPLKEQDLAERFGLGRTPVREAVQRLVGDGLLVVYPRKGMAVAPINPLDLLLALDARAPLERLAAAAAARRADPAQRARLLATARSIAAAAGAGDVARYLHEDHRFDQQLAEACGNPFAARALAPLQTMARRAWYYFSRERDLAGSAARHLALAEAIVRGDEAGADAAAEALVAHVREGLKQAFATL